MNRESLRLAARVVVLCAVFATFIKFVTGDPIGHSATWDDSDFFQAQAACDDNSYTATLENCRSQPGYPNNPTEADCRAQAGIAFGDCLDGIPSPSYSLDFCSMARGRRDACANIYGVYAQFPDFPAAGECRDASGVDMCE